MALERGTTLWFLITARRSSELRQWLGSAAAAGSTAAARMTTLMTNRRGIECRNRCTRATRQEPQNATRQPESGSRPCVDKTTPAAARRATLRILVALVVIHTSTTVAMVGGASPASPTVARRLALIVGSRGNFCTGVALARDL